MQLYITRLDENILSNIYTCVEMLNTLQIRKMLNGAIPNLQICASNQLSLSDKSCYAIINTKPHTHPGEHWGSLYYKGSGDKAEYFCSLGREMERDTLGILYEYGVTGYYYNSIQIQDLQSSYCGFYCILYALSKFLHHHHMDAIVRPFTKDLWSNDEICINQIVKIIETA